MGSSNISIRLVPDVEDEPFHFWTYRGTDVWYLDPNEYILCVKMGDTPRFEEDFIVNITILEEQTTCQKCLEWLHA